MGTRKILHLDLDAFFCAVEEILHPELKGKAFAVGGMPNERGVVASCSYPARQYGIHSAMPMSQAVSLYPRLIIVPSSHGIYSQYSERVMSILRDLTPLVEQISVDEAFLDVSDLPDPPLALARMLQKRILDQVGLPCSLGVAANKLVAKMATDFGKSSRKTGTYPFAIQIVAPGQEAAFLAPLPVQALWGIGPRTAARLAEYGIHTIGELARVPEATLRAWFGKNGSDVARHALGIDNSPVTVERAVKSISQEVTFDRDVRDARKLEDTLFKLSEQVAYRLRQENLCGTTVRLKLRWPDFTTHTRQISLPQPVDQDEIIFGLARQLFEGLWEPGKPVRLLGVGVSGLQQRAHQLSLWETPDEKERRLLEAVDALKQRFGKDVIRRGRDFSRSPKSKKSGAGGE